MQKATSAVWDQTPAHTASYEKILSQSIPIEVSPDGSFLNMNSEVAINWQRTIPKSLEDTSAIEAAQVFYSRNEFSLPVAIIPSFAAWQVNNCFRPSDLVTRLAIMYGPPEDPGGDNWLLSPLLYMPCLRDVRIVFRDRNGKGFGPYRYLRPSAWAILELQNRTNLKLQLVGGLPFLGGEDREWDITSYINVPTPEDEASWVEANTLIANYRGPCASYQGALADSGWNCELMWEELSTRIEFRKWAEEQRIVIMELQDVEMT